MNDDYRRQIKGWVLEHAVKNNIDTVVKGMFKDKFVEELCSLELKDIPFPTLVFELFLKRLVKGFRASKKDKKSLLSWDKQLLSFAIELLPVTYEQKHFVPFEVYIDLITRLKLIELLRKIYEGDSSSSVVQDLDCHFPRWNSKSKEAFKSNFQVDEELIKKIQTSESFCRRLVLRVIISDVNRKHYLLDLFNKDMKQFISESLVCLNTVIYALKSKEPSIINKILSGQYEKSTAEDFIAVGVVLEFLPPEPKAVDLTNFLSFLKSNLTPKPSEARFVLHSASDDLGFTQAQSIMEEISHNDSMMEKSGSQDNEMEVLPFVGSTAQFVATEEQNEIVADSEPEVQK